MTAFFKVPSVSAEDAYKFAYEQEFIMLKLKEAVQLLAQVDDELVHQGIVSSRLKHEIFAYFNHYEP